MARTKTVAHRNMGDRLPFDGDKFNVDVADLIKRIEALENRPIFQGYNLNNFNNWKSDVANLNTDIPQLGYVPFYGDIRITDTGSPVIQHGTNLNLGRAPIYVIGAPVMHTISPAWGLNDEVDSITRPEDVHESAVDGWDFTGFQLASPVEVVQVIFHQGVQVVRTNDCGMTVDGKIVNQDCWTKWKKV